jgi:hypothetical protein
MRASDFLSLVFNKPPFLGRNGFINVEKVWELLDLRIQTALVSEPALRKIPRASWIFTKRERGIIQNLMQWDRVWMVKHGELPFAVEIWEEEDLGAWRGDGRTSPSQARTAFRLINEERPSLLTYVKFAYRFVLPDSTIGECGCALRLAVVSKDCLANAIWKKPESVMIIDNFSAR